ncbi:DUF6388 family protein [Duganella levis]|uniref:Uncharacterized protein n=1 Tax=Duganella levis TaxID=2692169 RepID=A0ABW9VZ38_9BURK|nr:DUF6388 family protein [Duganella levis]MYN26957.1 hypothetical protein [Duganella levis]
MTKFTDAQMEKAYARFLESHPSSKDRIDSLEQGEADALGITMNELRSTEIMRDVRAIAKSRGIDSNEFFWMFVADTREEYDEMIAKSTQAMKAALGI